VRFRRRGLPPSGRAIVEEHLAVWPLLDADEQQHLLADVDQLLATKTWEAARGFVLDDTVRVVIAAQAALLVLGLSLDHYRGVSGIIVHPTTVQTRGPRPGPSARTISAGPHAVLGLAQDGRGPVVLAWDRSLAGAHSSDVGRNLVLHEFAHKLDMQGGMIDGTPPMGRDLRADWVRVCTEVYDALVAGVPRPPLRSYGATNPGEFFAVATEAFFEQPHELRNQEPALYDVLLRFYRQDPSTRDTRA
jgi:Mlc titration factor MtfA (ptsG expression regulator)